MKRLTTGIWLLAVACILLAAPVAEAKLLYEETVTITLEDGTAVFLVLDDHGISSATTAGQDRVHQAKFDYLGRTAAERQRRRPGPPYAARRGRPSSSVSSSSSTGWSSSARRASSWGRPTSRTASWRSPRSSSAGGATSSC